MDLSGKASHAGAASASPVVLWSENLGLFRHSANNSLDNRTTNYDAVLLPEETDVKSEDEGARSEALFPETEATTPLLSSDESYEATTAEWAHTNDGVLQDILSDPLSSVKEIVSLDTVILNQVHGASIHWDELDPKPYLDSGSNSLCGLLFHVAACWCLLTPVYIAFCIYHKLFHGYDLKHQPQWLAWLVFVSVPVTAAIALSAPVVLLATRTCARRPFKSRLVGIEGVVDAGVLEKYLWGFDHGNLTETTAQSYRESDEMQQESAETRRDFTLLDTHLMTVTHFRSHVPPTAMFVVGEEAGKQRALLCSYNHRTETFHREDSQIRPEMPRGDVPGLWEVLFCVICIVGVPPIRVRIVETFRHYEFYYLLSHKLSIVCGYVPAVAAILCSDRPLEAMPYALVMKSLIFIAYERLYRSLGALYGIMDGSLSLLLVTAILTWYSLEEMVLRILLWAVVIPRLFKLLMLFEIAFGLLGIEIVLIGITMFSFLLAIFTRSRGGFSISGIIGTPQDVAWLPSDQKVQISQEAAMGKFITPQSLGDLWPARKPRSTAVLRGGLIFAASIVSTWLLGFRSTSDVSDYLGNTVLALVVIALGFAVCRAHWVSYQIMVTCSIVSGFIVIMRRLGWISEEPNLVLRVLMDLNQMVPPTATWPEAVITIGLTFAGGVLGQLIFASKNAMTQKPWGLWSYFLLFLIQTVIWAVLWIYGWMGSRREKMLGRTVALEDMSDQETGRQEQEYRTYYGAFDRA
ncbi:hypothetical protein CSOJ01_14832 [Colletotrichum sojae]|uniref:Transmembrane protein n=1 Tax=Colletotrichum sojae TaxID=2175907 RepID=A0A8H6MJP0_9PEZI|nr:hypothetical protein CSOJ01_14832 [Colletotrichum sojae]